MFFKTNVFKKFCLDKVKVSNGLDPDKDCCYFDPDLEPNCLQRLSGYQQMTKIIVAYKKLNIGLFTSSDNK